MIIGQRHSVRCECILTQHSEEKNPPFFHFVVFSVIDNNVVKPKIVQCPNCGILHRVVDINMSKILRGKEESRSLVTFEDIKSSMPVGISKILEQQDLDITQWEMARFIIDNQKWGEHIVLSNEIVDGIRYVKYVRILGAELFRVDTQEFEES